MEIRKARLSDAQGIASVLVDSWRFAYAGIMSRELLNNLCVSSRASGWKEHLASGADAWVLMDNDDTVGVAEFGEFRDSIPECCGYGEIYVIYLAPAKIGRGLGALLMQHCVDSLRAQGFEQVGIWVLAKNSRAINFYQRCAFQYSGLTKEHAGTGLIEHLYQVDISP